MLSLIKYLRTYMRVILKFLNFFLSCITPYVSLITIPACNRRFFEMTWNFHFDPEIFLFEPLVEAAEAEA